ncbi:MAG TPA: SemiSWEET family transporter [Chitinophagales bacterium]|nr:SemiSWEET family transporter [Chitinophagales bacterium]
MDVTTIVGIFASIFTAVSMLPQLIKLIKEKMPTEISYFMLLILLIGLSIWVWYGFRKEDWIIIVSNGFSFLVNLSVLILEIFLRKKTKTSA